MAIMLVLNITSACNFRCQTCLREHPDETNHLSVNLLDKALADAGRLGIREIAVTGGEPCLHPEFEKIVETIVKNGFPFGVVSNGSFREKYEFLVEKHKDKILYMTFSLDGATEEIQSQLRQPGSFSKVCDSIRFFSSCGLRVHLAACLNKINKHQIEQFIQLAKELGARVAFFMSATKTSFNEDILLDDREKKMYRFQAYELGKKHSVRVKTASSLGGQAGIEFCRALNLSGIEINPKGEISFCCDNIGDGAVVGSLKDHTFFELYSKCLDLSHWLKKKRVEMLEAGEIMEGFNTCEFCNTLLASYIKRPNV